MKTPIHSLATVLLLTALAFAALPAPAAVTEAWVQRYNNLVGGANDSAFKVVHDRAGDIIVTGISSRSGDSRGDLVTIKYSGVDGTMLWQQLYDADEYFSAVAVDGNGNVFVTGSSVTIKYLPDGTRVWSKTGFAGGPLAVDRVGNVVVISWTGITRKFAALDGALLWETSSSIINGHADFRAVTVDSTGNVIVAGSVGDLSSPNYDWYTAKYAADDGKLLWEKRYDGPANRDDIAFAVAADGSDNVVVTGYSWSDCYTAKYAAADGALLWEKRGPAGAGVALVVDGSGNVVVTGNFWNGNNTDYYTAKYAAVDGALVWEQRYYGATNREDGASAVAVDALGNVAVTGLSYNIQGDSVDFYTAKYAAADGSLLWERRYDGGYDEGWSVVMDDNGNVVVTGLSSSGFDFNTDCYTAKYAGADGTLLWEKRYDGSVNYYDSASAVAVDGSGNVVVTGYSFNGSNDDFYTAKYAAADGALLWEQRYNSPANNYDQAWALAVDGSGDVVVTGSSWNETGVDYYTAKYAAADGTLLWEKRYNGAEHDTPAAVAVDGSGNVVVTGLSGNPPNYDYYTAKYASADGALLWEQRYNGPADDYDISKAVAVDRIGNVVVTGLSGILSQGLVSFDYYTAKYAASDGALLWEQRYAGPGNEYAQALAVDGSGNVVVTGVSETGSGPFGISVGGDYYTAKYAAADGALIWEQHYNGPANGGDYARALAVDGSGNVVVTGSSHSTNFNFDYYTAKYAAADGALIWEQRHNYNGTANSYDNPSALAVDGSGNVVVTGYSQNGAPNYDIDYYTTKYATASGAVLWEMRYDGPANGHDNVGYRHSLALGANGTVAITGSSSGDFATVVYREIFPPVIACPANTVTNATGTTGAVAHFTVTATDDSGVPPTVTCTPPSGSVFPIGQTTVTCAATDGDGLPSTCSFTVKVRGARGVKQNALAELVALRATVSERDDGRTLDEAISHLTQSLAAEFWLDETHLERKHGEKVFQEEKATVRNLCGLIRNGSLPDMVLQGLVDQLLQADRLLASAAIDEAIAAGVSGKKIEQARKFVGQGDAEAADGQCATGIEDYRNAWELAVR